MSPVLAAPLFVGSLVVTLAAARVFARRLDRIGVRFGFPEPLIGLLTAVAADGPEICTALVALIKGAHSVSVGVLMGSNVFNLAAMLGLSALLVGSVRLPREALLLEGLVGAFATATTAAVLLGWLPALPAVLLLGCVLVPYVLLLIQGPALLRRLPVANQVLDRVAGVFSYRQPVDRRAVTRATRPHHLVALAVLDVALIVAGSTGMVQAALALGDRWRISGAVLGVLILAPLTSIPNALTAVRLGLSRRGSALVGETFNSNTINLVAGVTVPALFVGVGSVSGLGRFDVAWLVAMTTVSLFLLARRGGMRRAGAAALISLYAMFVAVHLLAA